MPREASSTPRRPAASAGSGRADRFFDLSALHLLTTSTLEHLRELEPAADFDERRFRPNLVLEPGTPGFAENDWVGKVLDLERLRIVVVRRTGRCVMPTLAQRGLGLDRLTLKAIARFNKVESPPTVGPTPCAGVYATVEGQWRAASRRRPRVCASRDPP